MKSHVTTQRSEVATPGSEVRPCAPSEPFTRSDSFRYDDQGLVEHQITFTATHGWAGRCHSNNTSSNSRPCAASASTSCGRVMSSCSSTDVGSSKAPAGSGQPIPKRVLLLGSALFIGVAVLLGVACLSRAAKEQPTASKQ